MNEISATVALDGGTRRCCDNPDCNNVWPCKLHPDNSGGRVMMTAEQLRKPTFERTVSVDRAEVAAQRLTNSHFKTPPHARVSIPRNQDDDDIVIFDFIAQAAAQLAEKEREIERLTITGLNYHDQWKAAEERHLSSVRPRKRGQKHNAEYLL